MGKQKPELPRLLPNDVFMRDGYLWEFDLWAKDMMKPVSIDRAKAALNHALAVLDNSQSADQIDAVSHMRVSDIDPLGR